MKTTAEDYEPFGNEWFLEMKKLPKTLLINMLRDAFISASLKEEKATLKDKIFEVANELAVLGYGNEAIRLHQIHNSLPPLSPKEEK